MYVYHIFLKDYTFLGLVFGLLTALYLSIRNGVNLKVKYPEVLCQAKMFV